MDHEQSSNLAVLIDADNAQPKALTEILNEIAKYGTATVKRAYGDWTTTNLGGWKDLLHVHAVQPIQQFSYTTGKNATDSALIIDAMDLLHRGKVDGFCLVSSDSDFTRLATRIRESGLVVYGFGEQKTPEPFVKACDKFIYTEILAKDDKPSKRKPSAKAKATKKKASGSAKIAKPSSLGTDAQLKRMLTSAIDDASQEDGWAFLGAVGSLLTKIDPAFDSRNFGYKKLGDLVRRQPYVEVKGTKAHGDDTVTQIYVRLKEA
jgi:uncharacterized LabA/DUF88 family protein